MGKAVVISIAILISFAVLGIALILHGIKNAKELPQDIDIFDM